MPISQGGVYRIRGSELSPEAGDQSINVVVVSNADLHALEIVWMFPIEVVKDPNNGQSAGRVRIEDIKRAKVAESSYVDCTNLIARKTGALGDSPHVGAQAIGNLSRGDWKRVRRALEQYIRDRR
jgi:hypothetical protein